MDWVDSQYVTLISFLLAMVGLVLTVVFYYKGKRDKEPCWAIQTVNLFTDYSGIYEGLEIQYKGETVKNLSISKIAFWNGGKLTIHGTDLTNEDPLRIEMVGNGQILDARLIAINNTASQFQMAEKTISQVRVSFDYVDEGHGFVMQVIHSGMSSRDFAVKGVIKGATYISPVKLRSIRMTDKETRLVFIQRIIIGFWICLIFALLLTGIWGSPKVGIILVIALSCYVWLWLIMKKKSPPLPFRLGVLSSMRTVPPGLEAFYADPKGLEPKKTVILPNTILVRPD